MDIQVNKDQLERVAIKWLNIYYGDLKQKEFDDHPDEMFYVNSSDEIMMSHLKAKFGKYIYSPARYYCFTCDIYYLSSLLFGQL